LYKNLFFRNKINVRFRVKTKIIILVSILMLVIISGCYSLKGYGEKYELAERTIETKELCEYNKEYTNKETCNCGGIWNTYSYFPPDECISRVKYFICREVINGVVKGEVTVMFKMNTSLEDAITTIRKYNDGELRSYPCDFSSNLVPIITLDIDEREYGEFTKNMDKESIVESVGTGRLTHIA